MKTFKDLVEDANNQYATISWNWEKNNDDYDEDSTYGDSLIVLEDGKLRASSSDDVYNEDFGEVEIVGSPNKSLIRKLEKEWERNSFEIGEGNWWNNDGAGAKVEKALGIKVNWNG